MSNPFSSSAVHVRRQSPCPQRAAGQAMVEYLIVAMFGVMGLFWGGDQSIAAQLVHAFAAQYQAFSYAISFTPQ